MVSSSRLVYALGRADTDSSSFPISQQKVLRLSENDLKWKLHNGQR